MEDERIICQFVVLSVKRVLLLSIMVQDCFGNCQTGNLKRVKGILNKEGYHRILIKHAIPSGKRLIKDKLFFFQQDNDPQHTSSLCKNYFANQENEGILVCMDHPSQSPDLNHIELLQDEVDRKTKEMHPKNMKNLWECL